jgi:hypothetical protein
MGRVDLQPAHSGSAGDPVGYGRLVLAGQGVTLPHTASLAA